MISAPAAILVVIGAGIIGALSATIYRRERNTTEALARLEARRNRRFIWSGNK